MKLYEFFEKNFGDKTINPIYYAVNIDSLTTTFIALNKRLNKRTVQDLGGGFTYRAYREDNETIYNDSEITNTIYKFLNEAVTGGIQSGTGDDQPSEAEKENLKQRVEIFIRHLSKRKFPHGFICENDGTLKTNGYLDKYYSDEVKKFISSETPTGSGSKEETSDEQQSMADNLIDFLKQFLLLDSKNTLNYTSLYLNYIKPLTTKKHFLTEAALSKEKLNDLFLKEENLKKLIELATPEQLNYIILKIIKDLPDSEIGKILKQVVDSKTYGETLFVTGVSNQLKQKSINLSNQEVTKVFKSIELPTPKDIPAGLETFGNPGGLTGGGTQQTSTTATSPTPSTAPADLTSAEDSTASSSPNTPGIDPTDKELEIYKQLYNANYNQYSPQDRANLEQIRKNAYSLNDDRPLSDFSTDNIQAYRAQSRRRSLEPVKDRFVRTGFNQFRPAVRADVEAGFQLFMQNPNKLYREFNPYVKVGSPNRGTGVISNNSSFNANTNRLNGQELGPAGVRREKDGRLERKSKFKGAVGSLSNFLGDVGNTLTGR